jgi:hypothetical protein
MYSVFSILLSFMGTWVLYKCELLVLMLAHVFLGEMGYFEFLIFWYN